MTYLIRSVLRMPVYAPPPSVAGSASVLWGLLLLLVVAGQMTANGAAYALVRQSPGKPTLLPCRGLRSADRSLALAEMALTTL